jgi:protein TonB
MKSRLLPLLALCIASATLSAQDRVIRVGGNVQPPRKLVDVAPVYPPDAREEGVSGVVILEVVVGTDGRVREDVETLRSPDDRLTRAATEAVRQWEYEVTQLNGEPVAVRFTVTINFTVNRE